MATVKVAIAIDAEVVELLDDFVEKRIFPSRSRTFQEAMREKLDKLARMRLARECAKLDSNAEQAIADEDLASALPNGPNTERGCRLSQP